MGLISFFKGRSKRKDMELRSIISDYYSKYIPLLARDYAYSAYDIPEVRTAVDFICRKIICIPKYHQRISPTTQEATYYSDEIGIVLDLKPNPLQNASQFWTSVITDLLLNGSVFLEPIFDGMGNLLYLYKLPLKSYQMTLDESGAWVQFFDEFKHPDRKYNMNSVIYLNRYSNTTGGKETNLGIYPQVIQALEKQIINTADPKKVRALIQKKFAGGNIKERDKKGDMVALKASFDDNVNGIAYIDPTDSVTPINWNDNEVNQSLMQLVINIIYNIFGVSAELVNNKGSEIENTSFVDNTLKPICKQMEEEFTAKIFTKREIQLGHRIGMDTDRAKVYTISAQSALLNNTLRGGVFSRDEIREQLGYPPLPNGEGAEPMISLDMIPSDMLAKYKGGQDNGTTENATENSTTGTAKTGNA